ncbi:bifunctional riboflavin kinase/FAD synthetase [Campylobacter sp. JMF_08 NE1]|uniref:bifunctional riboflavin kinase/FAD synthetase n=1 Tax=Campylobacter sp. JMF_08 NE1 TaxID=2983821 RepID=UPI0022EA0E05|nr:bifunctional riboflavin kinase/FAD synthetase [Campylobacter sp. JMF_08 NE1]MDA3047336.1 bifunctional riboflavin kinase/FAD synthetase [Campylobacter sp. JMF_08 NE1]
MDEAKMSEPSEISILAKFGENEKFLNLNGAKKSEIKALAIGNFDGFHRAHQKLFDALGEHGGIIIVIADTAPKLTPPSLISQICEKEIFYCDLARVKNLSGAEFIALLNANFPNLEKIVVGNDFKFGKNRASDAEFLRANFAGETLIIDEYKINGVGVHTRLIKEFLNAGECEKAAQFLGREYEISGKVISGQGLGAKELFATLNLDASEFYMPKFGVYATLCRVKNKIYKSVSFIGHRVSTDSNFAIETHILGEFGANFTPKSASVKFIKFIRENKKFENLGELKAQISSDIALARDILGNKYER